MGDKGGRLGRKGTKWSRVNDMGHEIKEMKFKQSRFIHSVIRNRRGYYYYIINSLNQGN